MLLLSFLYKIIYIYIYIYIVLKKNSSKVKSLAKKYLFMVFFFFGGKYNYILINCKQWSSCSTHEGSLSATFLFSHRSPREGTIFSPTHVLFFSIFLLDSFILSLQQKKKKKKLIYSFRLGLSSSFDRESHIHSALLSSPKKWTHPRSRALNNYKVNPLKL